MSIEVEQIKDIKQIRKQLELTQSQLSKLAGVSQSLIAKVEAGRLDPTYSNAKKLLAALQHVGKKHEMTAEEIMTTKLISVGSQTTIKAAIEKMKKFNISQIPVIEQHKSVGFISEATILEALLEQHGKTVAEVMTESPPVVSKHSPVDVISNLLKFYPLVLVSADGKLIGVITKSDLLDKVYR